MHVVLYQPEIPPNTGSVMRLCANAGARLHLIEPLGFRLEDRLLRRAGLDYREQVNVTVYDSLSACWTAIRPGQIWALTTRAQRCYADVRYATDDALLFGPETRGLPTDILNALPATQRLRIPMYPRNRSLNLANAVAVVLFEAWRQQGFVGAALPNAPESL